MQLFFLFMYITGEGKLQSNPGMSHLVSRDLLLSICNCFLFMYITGYCKVASFQVSVFEFVVLLFDLHCRL